MSFPKIVSENTTRIILGVLAAIGTAIGAYFANGSIDSVQTKDIAALEHKAVIVHVTNLDDENDRDLLQLKIDVSINMVDFRMDYLNDKIIRLEAKSTHTYREQRDLDMAKAEYTHQQTRKQVLLNKR